MEVNKKKDEEAPAESHAPGGCVVIFTQPNPSKQEAKYKVMKEQKLWKKVS